MLKHFLALEWKQFRRSSYFKQGIAVKIFSALAVLYFGATFIFLGIGAFFIIQEEMPEADPLNIINNYLVYWFILDIIYRFFLQKTPTLNIQPLMILPIPRKKVIHYLLGKTYVSIFNLLPLFFYVPFTIVLLLQGYSPLGALSWFLAMLAIEGTINYLNFLINKTNFWFYTIIGVLAIIIGLQYYDVYPVNELFGRFFNAFYHLPFLFLLPIALAILVYIINYRFIRADFYIDERFSKAKREIRTYEMQWLNRFGKLATFLKNDLRLIWRNKRPRQVLMMSGFFLFYGLIFFTNDFYKDSIITLVFVSTFITGGFLFSFGQLVPSWDSEYYRLLMSQNIPYLQYIESKWLLIVVSVFLSLILSIPYLYFGKDIFILIIATAFFNVGVNSYITILGGVYNRIPVKLDVKAKAFENMKGFSFKQVLIGIPKILAPILIFYPVYFFTDTTTASIVLGVVGIIGLLLRKVLLKEIEKIYQEEKHEMIKAYSEKN